MHEASVTFLGFGLSPHEPAIGIILSESMKYLATGNWWLALFPGLSLLIISVPSDKDAGFEAVGDIPLGDRLNMAYMSTSVAYGRGEGIVTATGTL